LAPLALELLPVAVLPPFAPLALAVFPVAVLLPLTPLASAADPQATFPAEPAAVAPAPAAVAGATVAPVALPTQTNCARACCVPTPVASTKPRAIAATGIPPAGNRLKRRKAFVLPDPLRTLLPAETTVSWRRISDMGAPTADGDGSV